MISDKIGLPALLEQLAEECAELAHAALKEARILRGENPTPVDIVDARKALAEEYADVEVCVTELNRCGQLDLAAVVRSMEAKRNRWLKRLEARNAADKM